MKRLIKSGDPRIAVAYLRVSTEDQRLGPEAQRAAIEAWATRNTTTVVAWCIDQGVSGGSDLDDRPGLVTALNELRRHGAGILGVAKRDRLARDVGVAAAIDRAAHQCGARVVSADGMGNGDDPAEQFMRRMLDAAAEYERALIRARTRAALAVKRGRFEYTGGEPPYGFDLIEGRLAPNSYEQHAIRRARRLREGGWSLRQIAAALANRGQYARNGKEFCAAQVLTMVRGIEVVE
jgi:site-specific DNA recombinase